MRRAFALALVLTLASAWPLVTHLGSALPSDLGDPILNAWILWWNAHHAPLTAAWWDAPMFVPLAGTFAMSEALIALLPLTNPMQWLGASPISAHNVAFLLSTPMAALGAFALAKRITGRNDAALIAAAAFGFSPYRIGQLSHLQVLWTCWMPLGLAALHGYLDATTDRARVRSLAAFAVCWTMNGFTNGYFLVYFPVLVLLWMAWFARRWRDWIAIGAAALAASLPLVPMLLGYTVRQDALGLSRGISEIRAFSADLTAIVAASPRAWLSQLWTVDPGPEGELYPGLAVFVLVAIGLVIALRHSRERERAMPPGAPGRTSRITRGRLVLIGLASFAALLAILVMITGGSELHLGSLSLSVHRPSRLLTVSLWLGVIALATSPRMKRAWAARSPFAFYVLASGAMYLLALGPEPHAGATQILYKPPYAWLMYLPGFDSVRVPARFGVLMILCLAQAAALGFAGAADRWFKVPGSWFLVRGSRFLVRGSMTTDSDTISNPEPGTWNLEPRTRNLEPGTVNLKSGTRNLEPGTGNLRLTRIAPAAFAVAILAEGWIVTPVAMLPPQLEIPERARAAGTLVMELPIAMAFEPNTIALLHSLDHRQPLINGFSGYMPAHYHALGVALDEGDATALAAIREVGPIAAYVDRARDTNGVQARLVAAAPGAEPLQSTDRGDWFLLPRLPAPAQPAPPGAPLAIASVDATNSAEDAEPAHLIDGNAKTRWHGQIRADEATDIVTLTLARPSIIDFVEIDQGLWAGAYARDLEIVLVTDQGDVSVFRGANGGAAVRAALSGDPDLPIRIAIPANAPAHAVKLISHPSGAKWIWSVGEIKLFGR